MRDGLGTLRYWLSEHPSIVGFRWNDNQLWGSSWSFLIGSIGFHVLLSLFLNFVLALFGRRRPLPLGSVPAVHILFTALISIVIFTGTLFSAVAEIRDTRWFWRRSKTPLQWLLCFPLGTRPVGRVFFWSYNFYLSQFLLLFRTFFSILRRRKLTLTRLFHHPTLIFTSFLWLEYSQSFQLVAILTTTLAYSVIFGYRFWVSIGLPRSRLRVVVGCQLLLLGFNMVGHVGVAVLHFRKGGCNGIGALFITSVLNVAHLLVFMNCYVKGHLRRNRTADDDPSNHSSSVLEGKKDS